MVSPSPLVFSDRAAETVGCRVHGITLSKEQKALAEEKVPYLPAFALYSYALFH